jgi:hypothetical protein
MPEMISYCGITCTECPTYVATQKNDNRARIKIAEEWSRQYQHPFKPEDINCAGCLATGQKQLGYCAICEIRQCGSAKKVINCGYCGEYPCEKVNKVHIAAPLAKAKLDAIKNGRHKA